MEKLYFINYNMYLQNKNPKMHNNVIVRTSKPVLDNFELPRL